MTTSGRTWSCPHLRVFVAEPHYLLAMKCAAMRLGAEALEVVTRYFDEDRLPLKTRLALEELLEHRPD